MRREIEGRVYDTAMSDVVASYESGSTHVHRVSSLYRSRDGAFFLIEEQEAHGVDGAHLIPLTPATALEWLKEHGKTDVIASLFGTSNAPLRLELEMKLLERLKAAAAAEGISAEEWVIAAIRRALDSTLSYGTG